MWSLWLSCSIHVDLGFLLDGQLYGNNSVVTVTDIGSSFFMSALFCLTPSLECCSDSETPNAASVTREWYLPDGTPVPSTGTVFSREQVSSAVALYRSGGTSPSGVYCCEIPDASATRQNIYIGIYPQGDGEVYIHVYSLLTLGACARGTVVVLCVCLSVTMPAATVLATFADHHGLLRILTSFRSIKETAMASFED